MKIAFLLYEGMTALDAVRPHEILSRLPEAEVFRVAKVEARIVEDGKVMTAAGVSASIDMALTLAAKIAGPQFAKSMQLGIEYDPQPPFDEGSPGKDDPSLCKALKSRMVAAFEEV